MKLDEQEMLCYWMMVRAKGGVLVLGDPEGIHFRSFYRRGAISVAA